MLLIIFAKNCIIDAWQGPKCLIFPCLVDISQHIEAAIGDALRDFSNFTGKQLCQSLFLIKSQALGLQLY